ncbi:MAG: phosphoribosyltransferase family protein [Bacteroidota bacterium]
MPTLTLNTYIEDFTNLFFPKLCLACNKSPVVRDEITCVRCQYELAVQENYKDKENDMMQAFWGRVPLEMITSMYTFVEKGRVRNLVHQLKYRNQKNIGIALGKTFGKKLAKVSDFESVDVIVPVPLHPRKERKRGYNQSEAFGQGLAESMQKSHLAKGLKRVIHKTSLTRKSRDVRFESIKDAYEVREKKKLAGKHILLVDDVLTTGATIEACARKLLQLPGVKLSIAVIAQGEL